jgi:hypothetical protein
MVVARVFASCRFVFGSRFVVRGDVAWRTEDGRRAPGAVSTSYDVIPRFNGCVTGPTGLSLCHGFKMSVRMYVCMERSIWSLELDLSVFDDEVTGPTGLSGVQKSVCMYD